ncbi:MAG: strictosidine synthase [Rhizobiaceae bacterium]
MMSRLRRLFDWRPAGAGSATVPPMDGVLTPNQAIEEAPALLAVEAPDNLVSDGRVILFSSGASVMTLATDGSNGASTPFARFETPVSALALHRDGAVAVGLEDGRVLLKGGRHDGRSLSAAGDRAMICPTALLFVDSDTLLVALGSQKNGPQSWKHDLMQRGASGSVWTIDLESGRASCLGDRMAWPCGLMLDANGSVTVSESWRSRLVRLRGGAAPETVLADIVGYPARLAPKPGGVGSWLSVFAPRSQLVEFVLREHDYRHTMMEEIEPRYWIAPSLGAGRSFLEPMQVGGLKQLGILKAWAPTRSYGLVIGLDADSEPVASFHSRADGQRHGVTSSVEFGGRLIATSKGGDVIVSIALAADGRGANR